MLHTFDSLTIPDPADMPDIVPAGLALPTRTLEPDQVLYEADRDASSLYVVDYGVLKAVVPTSLGRDRIADLYGPGDVLGLAALDGGRHPETVVAVHESSLTPIDPQQAMSDRKLREYVMRAMARQLRRSREMIDEAEMPVGARVTRAFLRLARQFGQTSDEQPGMIKLPAGADPRGPRRPHRQLSRHHHPHPGRAAQRGRPAGHPGRLRGAPAGARAGDRRLRDAGALVLVRPARRLAA
jgi:CRP-like cAMP-binding protein